MLKYYSTSNLNISFCNIVYNWQIFASAVSGLRAQRAVQDVRCADTAWLHKQDITGSHSRNREWKSISILDTTVSFMKMKHGFTTNKLTKRHGQTHNLNEAFTETLDNKVFASKCAIRSHSTVVIQMVIHAQKTMVTTLFIL